MHAYGQDSRLVFILSAERSGSTLLSAMLGAHSLVLAPPELHLLMYETVNAWRQGYPAALDSLRSLLESCRMPFDDNFLTEQLGHLRTQEVYDWLLARGEIKSKVLIDKTPKYARQLHILERTEPFTPSYIWLLRHPLGVAASQRDLQLQRRRRHAETRLISRLKYPLFRLRRRLRKHQDVGALCSYWTDVNTNIATFLRSVPSERYQQVLFGQLVADPHAVMRRLCDWFGLQFEPAMLRPWEHVPKRANLKTGDPKLILGQHQTIDATVASTWRQQYAEDLLDKRTRRCMVQLGMA